MNQLLLNGNYATLFEELKFLGGGGFGSVFEVRSTDNINYAVKKIPHSNYERETNLVEVTFLEELNREENIFVIRYFTHWFESNYYLRDSRQDNHVFQTNVTLDPLNKLFYEELEEILHIQMELCTMPLSRVIASLEPYKNDVTQVPYQIHPVIYDVASQLFIQIVNGVNYLHDRSIIHRDLSPKNILIAINNNPDSLVRICDLGLSIRAPEDDDFIHLVYGTERYKAPDYKLGYYGLFSDLFSIGVIAEDLFCLDLNQVDNRRNICEENHFIFELMCKLVSILPKDRGTCADILNQRDVILINHNFDQSYNFITSINM